MQLVLCNVSNELLAGHECMIKLAYWGNGLDGGCPALNVPTISLSQQCHMSMLLQEKAFLQRQS